MTFSHSFRPSTLIISSTRFSGDCRATVFVSKPIVCLLRTAIKIMNKPSYRGKLRTLQQVIGRHGLVQSEAQGFL